MNCLDERRCPECSYHGSFRYDNMAHCSKCGHSWTSEGAEYDTIVGVDAYGDIPASEVYEAIKRHWTGVALGRN